ncbi:MAG TPA: radical SAM protein [Methanomassiliicoccales archaeon]|nr:radical SAM protein [Methanomassiliicoccales archaeon]
MTRVLVIDGYIDEPACLGVPPYMSPLVRAAVGAARDAGAIVDLVNIDEIRKTWKLPRADVTLLLGGCAVPGRYLGGMPASDREVMRIGASASGVRVLGGPASLEVRAGEEEAFEHVAEKDPAAMLYDILIGRPEKQRWRDLDEWNRWLLRGADSVLKHPDYPQPLIAEVETYRGCVRYRSGGCSFCIEPLKKKPVFREPEDIVEEVRKLRELGVTNFRLGAQTCFISYKAKGNSETPTPDPEAIESLLSGISRLGIEVLHLDNANPAVIASHPEESGKVLQSIVRHCTSGNVLALGMESADPQVVEANNLNATADQVMEAVRLINEAGKERGPTGLPRLLPGINLIAGLDGETPGTFDLNLKFLRELRSKGYWLRRINIRQVMPIRREFESGASHSAFVRFKNEVREEIDNPMLREILPIGTELTKVFLELREGKRTFGRQVGTYPLLVGFNYPLPLREFVDAKIVDWGQRSVTAVEFPLDINSRPLAALESLPSIGKKRAVRLLRNRPYAGLEDLKRGLDDPTLASGLYEYLSFAPRSLHAGQGI